MLNTHSSFRYGHEVTNENSFFPIDEGSGEIQVELRTGSYTLTDFAIELARALNTFSDIENNYVTTVDYSTGQITISGDSTFSILLSTSSILAISVYSLAGFTGSSDLTGASSYQGDARSGFIYNTQFKLQDYTPLEDQEALGSASINIPATGAFEEVVTYGSERLTDMKLDFITSIPQTKNSPIRNNETGLEDLRSLLRALIRKQPVEFCRNEDDHQNFEKLILSSTRGNRKGTGYKIKEKLGQNQANYYEIDLTFREIQ